MSHRETDHAANQMIAWGCLLMTAQCLCAAYGVLLIFSGWRGF